jgi:hypothetical protein
MPIWRPFSSDVRELSATMRDTAGRYLVMSLLCPDGRKGLDENMEFARPSSNLRLALSTLRVVAAAASATFKSRAALHLENLALRHQLSVLHHSVSGRDSIQPIACSWHGCAKF